MPKLRHFNIRLQRYYKKCTYASKRVIILQKDRLIYLIYPSAAIGSLLTDGCRWVYDRVLTIFENNYESLEYGLHDADVLSGECATAQAASESTAFFALQIYCAKACIFPYIHSKNEPTQGFYRHPRANTTTYFDAKIALLFSSI